MMNRRDIKATSLAAFSAAVLSCWPQSLAAPTPFQTTLGCTGVHSPKGPGTQHILRHPMCHSGLKPPQWPKSLPGFRPPSTTLTSPDRWMLATNFIRPCRSHLARRLPHRGAVSNHDPEFPVPPRAGGDFRRARHLPSSSRRAGVEQSIAPTPTAPQAVERRHDSARLALAALGFCDGSRPRSGGPMGHRRLDGVLPPAGRQCALAPTFAACGPAFGFC